jgi:hypothetical protein
MNQKENKLRIAAKYAQIDKWDLANEVVEGFGIRFIKCAGRELKHINLGDTYEITICKEGINDVFIGSWGNWYEETQKKYCSDNGMIRCDYCGDIVVSSRQ